MIEIQRISLSELVDISDQWDALLDASCPDCIFLSSAWITSWWDSWGRKQSNFDPFVLLARNSAGQLIGIAPLYVSAERVLGAMSIKRLQFIGSNFRTTSVTRTEYLDLLAHPDHQGPVLSTIFEYLLENCAFDEFVITDIMIGCQGHRHFCALARKASLTIRCVDEDEGTAIALNGTFQTYLKRLGRSTRLHLFNRRKLLESIGKFEILEFDKTNLDEGFRTLDRLVRLRWHQNLFESGQIQFHKTLLDRLCPDKSVPKLSAIQIDGECVSILYNIRFGKTEYNFLSGFVENFDTKLSLGTLHLGYAIEGAYTDKLECFDLLLGKGQRSNYKRHFRGKLIKSETLQIIRNPMLIVAYKAHDVLTNLSRRFRLAR